MNFTDQDIQQLQERGIEPAQVLDQLQTLKKGIPFVDLQSAATANNGLLVYTEDEHQRLVNLFESKKETLDLLKFTPASGAATRMFKFLFEFLENYNLDQGSINAYINKFNVPELRLFFVGLDSFPFYKKINKRLKKKYANRDFSDLDLNRLRFVQEMLNEDTLNFGKKPKGLFPFHAYKRHIATAFEEHLFESALYATKNRVARLHFTISEAHRSSFHKRFKKRRAYIESKTGMTFDITYSYQESCTDTVAMTSSNQLLRDKNGALVFRPGGHGALINNLNKQEADLIFIKNIDNVVVSKYKKEVAFYKKMLAGKLIELQEKSYDYLRNINNQKILSEHQIKEVVAFLTNELHLKTASGFAEDTMPNQVAYLKRCLDRPLRVCGMVRNEGEPGGGPFWIRGDNNTEGLQIIESVQIDPENEAQQVILNSATHFNPVDIVCGVKDYKGQKYDLSKFINPKSGFIAHKSYEGEQIKALEHPGLWNGAMAHWNTIFVEVPLITFDPVKTVNDLLKPAHQVK